MEISHSYLSQISSGIMNRKSQADIDILGQNLGINNNEEVKKVADDFEAVFLTQMIQHMFSGIETNELFGGGHGEDTFKTLLFDEYGKTMSKAGGIGVSEHVQRELLAMQEV